MFATSYSHGVRWYDWAPPLVFVVGILAAVFGGMYAAMPSYTPAPDPAFSTGQIVQMRAFGTEGMVVSSWCRKGRNDRPGYCTYDVRFSSLQMHTNTTMWGSDGPIDMAPVALVRNIREFELERAQ